MPDFFPSTPRDDDDTIDQDEETAIALVQLAHFHRAAYEAYLSVGFHPNEAAAFVAALIQSGAGGSDG